jgi:hypothetical protein
MDNMYPPTGDGDPQDSRRTDQFWTSHPGPAGGNPQDPAGPPQPSHLEQHYTRDRRHALRWTVGLSLALVLAAGGVIAGVSLASHPPASSFSQASDSTAAHSGTSSSGTSSSGTAAAGQPQSQAAALSSVLNAAGTSGALTLSSAPAATGGTAKAAAQPAVKAVAAAKIRACRRALAALRAARRSGRPARIKAARAAVIAHCHGLLRRHRLFRFVLLRGVVGQFTFRTKQGTLRTLAFERGVIESASGNAIVVRTVTGITETWHLVGNTVVREHGEKTSRSALTSGEPVWVGGPVISGARDARLIVIRPPSAPHAAMPAPSASGS